MKQVIVIFGASGGVGSVLAQKISLQGSTAYLLGRNEKRLLELSEKLNQRYFCVDASSESQVQSVFEKVIDAEGQVDGVVSLVGSLFLKPLSQTTQQDFEDVMKTNATSAFCILKHAIHAMEKGSIVLTSSSAAQIGLANHESISAAKAAVEGLVRSGAASCAHRNIRVNGIAPGLIKTHLTESLTSNEAALKTSIAFHPLGRIGQPEDVAGAIMWLLSDQSAFVTGSILTVDGGLSCIKLRQVF